MTENNKNKKRDLPVTYRIALCGVAVMGKDYAPDAFKMCHDIRTENPKSLGQMVARWLNSDKAKDFLSEVNNKYADTLLAKADEGEELNERQLTRIIERGIVTEKDAKKQADMSLKLMAWRKDTQEGNEKKSKANYYLPVASSCKACKIMGFFLEMNRHKEITDQTFEQIASMRIGHELKKAREHQAASRERIRNGCPKSGDDNESDAIGRIFSNLLTWDDVLDIYDYFRRMQSGNSDSVPHWKEKKTRK